MPVHPHHRSEGLEPEWVCEPAQQLVTAVVVDDRLAHDSTKTSHAIPKPLRDASSVQGKVGAASSSRHAASPSSSLRATLPAMTRAISSATEVSSPAMPS